MKIPYSIVLIFIYVGLVFCSMMIIREVNKEPLHEQTEQMKTSKMVKYMSVRAETAARSLCSKSSFIMRLYRLKQQKIFESMEPGVDLSDVIKRLDDQIDNIQELMDRDRKILNDEGVLEQSIMNCQYFQ